MKKLPLLIATILLGFMGTVSAALPPLVGKLIINNQSNTKDDDIVISRYHSHSYQLVPFALSSPELSTIAPGISTVQIGFEDKRYDPHRWDDAGEAFYSVTCKNSSKPDIIEFHATVKNAGNSSGVFVIENMPHHCVNVTPNGESQFLTLFGGESAKHWWDYQGDAQVTIKPVIAHYPSNIL